MSVDQIIKNAVEVRNKIIRNLTQPNREDYSKVSRYKQAIEKHKQRVDKLLKLLMTVFHRYVSAIKSGNDEVQVSVNKLNGMMAGGYKVRERQCKVQNFDVVVGRDGAERKIFSGGYKMETRLVREPKNWNYRAEVNLIVNMFFDVVETGTIFTGPSKYSPKKHVELSEAHIQLLLSLAECNKTFLRQFHEFFNTPVPEGFKVGEIIDVTFSEVVHANYDIVELSKHLMAIFNHALTEHERMIEHTQIKSNRF